MPTQQFDTILPEGFDGTFRFSNPSDEDFVGQWGGRGYLYPAKKETPMVIYDATPLEVQNIRKKFARDLAEREFFKSKKYEVFRSREGDRDEMGMIKPRGQGMSHAGAYNDSDLEPYIQQCLEPLPIAVATVTEIPKVNLEEHLARDDDNQIVTQAVDKKTSLRKKALEDPRVK